MLSGTIKFVLMVIFIILPFLEETLAQSFSISYSRWSSGIVSGSSPVFQIKGVVGEFTSGRMEGSDKSLLIGVSGGYGFLTDAEKETVVMPVSTALYQNYPNPFNPVTTISFDIDKESLVQLRIYDLLGSVVAVLVNDHLSPGRYSIPFNPAHLASGIYLYRLDTGKFVSVKKLTFLK
ncbi:MAG: T9SS type A sorting domain-containing protein [Ignavibacteriaceae bacterium]|nr:T9SS type A sorting domain-containing protein [Ignavibacteriaceae bacterium]